MRETLIRFIKMEEDEIFECGDGAAAVDLFMEHRPDWVLMDIRMEETNGIDATAKIIAGDPNARVIIVTDYGDKFFRRAAEKAGAIGFITKENLSEINSIVRRAK